MRALRVFPPHARGALPEGLQLHPLEAVLPARMSVVGRVSVRACYSTRFGTAGADKTSLAVYWAHRVAHRFPDGQLYVNLRGHDPSGNVMDPAEAIRALLDALGVPPEQIPTGVDAQAALYRSQLADRQVLVLLDNARNTAQVRPLLPGSRDCLALVTSRNQLTGLIAANGAHPIGLDLLTPDEARQLLARRLGSERLAAEAGAVDEIISRCAQLPLALALAAAIASTRAHLPLRALAGQLRNASTCLTAPSCSDDPATDARTVFSCSYHAAALRVLDHYLHSAYSGTRVLCPIRDRISLAPIQPDVVPEELTDHDRALKWFATERPVLIAAVVRATDSGRDTHAWQLAWSLFDFLDQRGL